MSKLKGRKLTLSTALATLKKKNDCKVDSIKRIIYILEEGDKRQRMVNDLGNKSHGKISYLQKEHFYTVLYIKNYRDIKK